MKKKQTNFCEEIKTATSVEKCGSLPEKETKVVQMKPVKQLTPEQISAKKTHDDCEKKVNKLLVDYLRDAKNDSLGADYHFKRYDNQWKTFATIKNKQQRDIIVNLDAFKKRVDFMMELANKQLKEQQDAQNESAATGEENQTPSEQTESLSE